MEGLQNVLHNLHAKKWHLTVYTAKTHIAAFRNGGKVENFETWTCMNSTINITDEFCNLGIPVIYNNKFSFLLKHLALKALFVLYSKCKHLSVNCKTMLDLFDTYITSILCY